MKDLYRGYAIAREAQRRLTTKYGTDLQRKLDAPMADGDALAAVSSAVRHHLGGSGTVDRPPADRDDCLAALTLADDARRHIDHDEMVAIEGALAQGASWQEIGVALGHTAPTAERAARTRYGALRRRFPSYQPIEQPTSDSHVGEPQ